MYSFNQLNSEPMASLSHNLLLSFILLLSLASLSTSQRPHALLAPVRKDAATLQYVTRISQRTPSVLLNLVLDLGGRNLWVDCDANYISTTYRPVRCRSAACSLAKSTSCGDCFSSPRPGCNNHTCGVSPYNPITHTSTGGELAQDALSLSSTNGFNLGESVSVGDFIFACAPAFLLKGLARGASGVAGLGRDNAAAPAQLASAFSFYKKFALCLSWSTFADGVVLFGEYSIPPGTGLSLMYTPLIMNPVCTAGTCTAGERSVEYFINVSSIKVNGQVVPINSQLLKIDSNGNGGTKISTVDPYTILETSIYKAVTDAFVAGLAGIKRVPAVAPFGVCYNASDVGGGREGPEVPLIELVLQSESVVWGIYGANSMVQANEQVLCLGFLDGGEKPRTSIVIGGHQIEDNLLEFDLARSRLGFTSTLLLSRTTCATFNLTSSA